MNAQRGELWLVDFGNPVGREQAGRRPAVVVSANPLNESRAEVVVVLPCTTANRGLPSHVEIEPGLSGLTEVSYAKGEDIKSISTERLVGRLGVADDEEMFAIRRVLQFLLDI